MTDKNSDPNAQLKETMVELMEEAYLKGFQDALEAALAKFAPYMDPEDVAKAKAAIEKNIANAR